MLGSSPFPVIVTTSIITTTTTATAATATTAASAKGTSVEPLCTCNLRHVGWPWLSILGYVWLRTNRPFWLRSGKTRRFGGYDVWPQEHGWCREIWKTHTCTNKIENSTLLTGKSLSMIHRWIINFQTSPPTSWCEIWTMPMMILNCNRCRLFSWYLTTHIQKICLSNRNISPKLGVLYAQQKQTTCLTNACDFGESGAQRRSSFEDQNMHLFQLSSWSYRYGWKLGFCWRTANSINIKNLS